MDESELQHHIARAALCESAEIPGDELRAILALARLGQAALGMRQFIADAFIATPGSPERFEAVRKYQSAVQGVAA